VWSPEPNTSGLRTTSHSLDERVNSQLEDIMRDIHDRCVEFGRGANGVDYPKGANIAIAGSVRLADAVLAQGLV
jgi:glutamate dehydrogenase (NADP+)